MTTLPPAALQHEIVAPTDLLDSNGNVAEPGFCRNNLYRFNRQNLNASPWRLKEWDFYQVSDGHYMVQMNFFDISYFSAFTAAFIDLHTGEKVDDVILTPLTPDHTLSSTSATADAMLAVQRGSRQGLVLVDGLERHLVYEGHLGEKPLLIDLTARMKPGQESITMATPFKEPGCFFYTQKLNCLPTSGIVMAGDKVVRFDPENTFTVMDWGRGVWPHASYWYWANGSTRLDGKLFGFELTWGIGIEQAATETALFYDGRCHKIGPVHVENDPEVDGAWMKPWHFMDDEGRLDLTMTPFFDHDTGVIVLDQLGMKSHQVHGLFNGFVVLDDGTRLDIHDMYAFCEKVHNAW